MEEKSWLETEMDETITLLRKKLEHINNTHPEHLTESDIRKIKDIYKSIYYIKCIRGQIH